jgi:hypothetical protein
MTLDLTDQQLNIIVELLQQAPYRFSAPLLQEIQKQVNAQQEGK